MALDRESEIFFLLDIEYRLQSDLNHVHERLDVLLGKKLSESLELVLVETRPKLTLIQGGGDGTAV